jgi:hypothetical protein
MCHTPQPTAHAATSGPATSASTPTTSASAPTTSASTPNTSASAPALNPTSAGPVLPAGYRFSGHLGFSSGSALMGLFFAACDSLTDDHLRALEEGAATHVQLLAEHGQAMACAMAGSGLPRSGDSGQMFGLAELFSLVGGFATVASEAASALKNRQASQHGGQP